jgi:uncharacterized protein YggE
VSRLVSAAGLAIVLVAPRAFSQAIPTPPRPAEITAAGRGEVAVTPDRAAILVSVESRAASAAAAASDNASKMAAVLKALRAAGLAQADITTYGYSVGQDPRSMRMGMPSGMPSGMPPGLSVPAEFLARNTVRTIVRRIDDTGKVIDAALGAGATSIASVQFSSPNTDEARRNALATAVAQAQRDAETLARAAGGSLGRLLSMSSSGAPGPMMPFASDTYFGYAEASGAAYPTMMNPREMSVVVSVFGRWEFIPGPSR